MRGLGSPLHAQGIQKLQDRLNENDRITPACAGNTITQVPGYLFYEDHPCMRREYLSFTVLLMVFNGSPLHAQGIHHAGMGIQRQGRITPACAGNTAIFSRLQICT